MDKKRILKIFKPNVIEILIVSILLVFVFKSCQPPLKRQITSTQSFELAWESDVVSSMSQVENGTYWDRSVFIRLIDDQVIMEGGKWGDWDTPSTYLISFNLESGQIDWQVPLSQYPLSIGSNSDDIVVILGHHPPREELCSRNLNYCEAAQVVSFDAASGEINWTFAHENMNRAGKFTVNDDVVSIIGSATRSSHQEKFSLNADTGSLIDFQDIEPILHTVNNRREYGEFVFYFDDNKNTLFAIDNESKDIVGSVQFDGDPGSNNQGLAIAANDDFVVVYLGDSQQLFVFRFEPDI